MTIDYDDYLSDTDSWFLVEPPNVRYVDVDDVDDVDGDEVFDTKGVIFTYWVDNRQRWKGRVKDEPE